MDKKVFLQEIYMGSDGDDFKEEFIDYLKRILKNNSFEGISEYQLFLQGGKKAIEEIIIEIERCV
jgi:hypothetical protein